MMRHLIVLLMTLVALAIANQGTEEPAYKRLLHLLENGQHKPIVDITGSRNIGYFVSEKSMPADFDKLKMNTRPEYRDKLLYLPIRQNGYLVVFDVNHNLVGFYTQTLDNQLPCQKNAKYYTELLGQTELSPLVNKFNEVTGLALGSPAVPFSNYAKTVLEKICKLPQPQSLV